MFINLQLGETLITPRVRLIEPLDLMKKLYNVDYEIVKDNINYVNDDALFLLRARTWYFNIEDALKQVQNLYNHDYLSLMEIDDSPKRWPEYAKINYFDFLGSHAVTCSTETLAEELREYNPNVKILKNQIANLAPPKNFEEKNYVTIFFAALNRKDSWGDIIPVLNKFAKKYGDKLHFMVMSDYDFFQSLKSSHKLFAVDKNLKTSKFVSYNIYMRELYKADIALLPLKDTDFNRKKSDLKFIECANAQVAAIASPTVYENSIKDGETGFIYKSPREFQAKLEILIKDKTKRIEMSKAAYEYVKRERLLKDHIAERYDWLKETYAKREELHADLINRCNALFKKFKNF